MMNKKLIMAVGAGILAALVIVFCLRAFSEKGGSGIGNPNIARAAEGVKLVLVCTDGGKLKGSGTAFCLNDEGYLVTNAHVVCEEKPDKTLEKLGPGKSLYICYEKKVNNIREVVVQQAIIEGVDVSKDLAWLRVEPDRSCLKPLALGNSPESGQFITALGFPAKFDVEDTLFNELWVNVIFQKIKENRKFLKKKISVPWSVELGDFMKVVTQGGHVSVVKNADKLYTGQGSDATSRLITHTAPISHGMSGGPVVDEMGRVVGITYGGKEELNRAVDVQELKHLLRIKKADKPGFYITGDPDGLLRRLRAYLSVARPYEVALAGVGAVLCLGALSTLCVLMFRHGGSSGRSRRPVSVRVSSPAPVRPRGMASPENNPLDQDKTVPFGAAPGREEATMPFAPGPDGAACRLVLKGTDPDGGALRFAVTEEELKSKRSLLMGSKRASCDICLPYPYISRQQARLIYRMDASGQGCLFLKDENATNTTRVNGSPVKAEYPLYPGDRITMGPVTLELEVEIPSAAR